MRFTARNCSSATIACVNGLKVLPEFALKLLDLSLELLNVLFGSAGERMDRVSELSNRLVISRTFCRLS